MKILLTSDWHVEFTANANRDLLDSLAPNSADVLVIAGDQGPVTTHYHEIRDSLVEVGNKFPYVIKIPGNHCYYHNSPEGTHFLFKEMQKEVPPNVCIVTSSQEIRVGGQRFLCGTLWFPFDVGNWKYANLLNDFRLIMDFAGWVYDECDKTKKWLKREMTSKDVVITHHLPSELCVAPQWKGDELNRFFVCEMFDVIEEKRPKLWGFGHTHNSVDIHIGNTRLVSNPYGYRAENNEFNPNLIIEV